MDWFKKISVKEYEDLIKNKNKMYNISKNFTSLELMNKYRDEDQVISKKIKINEQRILQNENLSKVFDKNLNKYFNEKDISKYNEQYLFENDNQILQSFVDVFKKYE